MINAFEIREIDLFNIYLGTCDYLAAPELKEFRNDKR